MRDAGPGDKKRARPSEWDEKLRGATHIRCIRSLVRAVRGAPPAALKAESAGSNAGFQLPRLSFEGFLRGYFSSLPQFLFDYRYYSTDRGGLQ